MPVTTARRLQMQGPGAGVVFGAAANGPSCNATINLSHFLILILKVSLQSDALKFPYLV
jgi:hypothetical protein